jgi:uncharacterized membrane protein YjjP (DUF1212 family)
VAELEILDNHPHKPMMEREELREVITLSLWAGQMLLQNGADTKRVEETIHRLGTSLGCDWMDIIVLPDAIIATTINNHEFRTKARRAPGRAVNMQLISEINTLSHQATAGHLDRVKLRQELRRIDEMPRNYNPWFVVFGVGLACAAFSRLFGADWPAFLITFFAASVAMFVRQELHKYFFNSLLIVTATAFIAGIIASSATLFHLSDNSTISIAASVLLLVPGVPLINAAEDLINGHILAGVIRGVLGLLIVFGIALGLILAIWITGVSVP